jgi:hypothetical protein
MTDTTSPPAPISRSGVASSTKPTWVCARKPATTTPAGNAHVSRQSMAQTRKIIRPKGRTVT